MKITDLGDYSWRADDDYPDRSYLICADFKGGLHFVVLPIREGSKLYGVSDKERSDVMESFATYLVQELDIPSLTTTGEDND